MRPYRVSSSYSNLLSFLATRSGLDLKTHSGAVADPATGGARVVEYVGSLDNIAARDALAWTLYLGGLSASLQGRPQRLDASRRGRATMPLRRSARQSANCERPWSRRSGQG